MSENNKDMKCQKCGANNANTHVKTIINGEFKEYDLCSECAHKMGYTNVFADMAVDNVSNYKSVGLELNANLNVLQISTPITVGLRTSYLLNTNSFAFDFLFNIDV